jgi:hypothetical protein
MLTAVQGKCLPYKRPRGLEGEVEVQLSTLNLGTRRRWVISTTPRPLYPRYRSGTHCIGQACQTEGSPRAIWVTFVFV